MKKCLKRSHISIDEKNLQNLGLKKTVNLIQPREMAFLSFQKEFFMLRSVK